MQTEPGFALLRARLADNAHNFPDLPAVDDLRRPPLSFSQLADVHHTLHSAFQENGIAQGVPVCVWIKCRADAAVLMTALATHSAVFPLEDTLTPATFQTAVRHIQGMALLHDGTAPDWITDTIAATGAPIVEAHQQDNWNWRLSNAAPQPKRTPAPAPDPSQVVLYLTTSGSSGSPKIVPVTGEAIATTTDRAAVGLALTPGETTLNVMPLSHVHGLISGVYLPWAAGCCTVMPGPYRASDFLAWLKAAQPQWVSTSPAIYADVLRRATASGTSLQDLPNLRFVRCGSAALNASLRARIRQAFGVPLLEAYGMSEALQIAGVPFDDPRQGSVGTAICDDIGIFDGDRQLPPGTTGEIRLRGRTVTPGYLGDRPRAQNDWFRTGDLGHLDEDGFLRVTGRMSDRMVIGGETIAPQEIEEEILRLPGVSETVVFPLPHPTLGERMMAAVVAQPGATLLEGRLRHALKARLPRIKIPTRIIVTADLPKSASGKIVRADIARQLAPQIEDQNTGTRPPAKLSGDPLEAWIQSAFAKVLDGVSIDTDDDFFEMGGTSHDAVELMLSLEEFLNETIHIALLFSAPTAKALAGRLRRDYPDALARAGMAVSDAPSDAPEHSDTTSFEAFRAALPSFVARHARPSDTAPVFILSAPRCGSTLLRVMLAGHPDIFAPPELRLMQASDLADWSASLDGPFRFFRDGLVQAVMQAHEIPQPEARARLDAMAQQGWTSVQVMDWLQTAVAGRVLIDKTPIYALFPNVLSHLNRSFPNARYIVLMRNPIDMMQSFDTARMHQLWMYPPQPRPRPDQLAEFIWRQSYETIEAFAEQIDPRRLMSLHFEDLVSRPSDVMPKLCRFLRLPFDPVVLTPYADPDKRMTKGLTPGAKMIGDPRFNTHSSIDPTRAVSGFALSKGQLSRAAHSLADRMGYWDDPAAKQHKAPVLEKMHRMTSQWGRSADRIGTLAFGVKLSPEKPPLFWMCQQETEAQNLAIALGPTQPLVYFRSAHCIVNRYDASITTIASAYARVIATHQPAGPIVLGGNCQGAELARETAKQLRQMGRKISLLICLDADFDDALPVPTAFLFGTESHLNPLRENDARHATWRTLYPFYTVDLLPCAHGQYFRAPIVDELARNVRHRLTTIGRQPQGISLIQTALKKLAGLRPGSGHR